MSGRCKTCSWFSVNGDFGECRHMHALPNIELIGSPIAVMPKGTLPQSLYLGFRPVMVHADFGCIHHEDQRNVEARRHMEIEICKKITDAGEGELVTLSKVEFDDVVRVMTEAECAFVWQDDHTLWLYKRRVTYEGAP